jgi:hypothetical protein
MIGYKYTTEQEALNAQETLRVHYLGEPQEGRITTQWVNVETGTFENESFWYIVGDFTEVLGTPTTFNIDTEDIQ